MEVHKSSIIVSRMCSSLDECEFCAFLMSRSDISAEAISQMVVDVPTMLVNVSAGPF